MGSAEMVRVWAGDGEYRFLTSAHSDILKKAADAEFERFFGPNFDGGKPSHIAARIHITDTIHQMALKYAVSSRDHLAPEKTARLVHEEDRANAIAIDRWRESENPTDELHRLGSAILELDAKP